MKCFVSYIFLYYRTNRVSIFNLTVSLNELRLKLPFYLDIETGLSQEASVLILYESILNFCAVLIILDPVIG